MQQSEAELQAVKSSLQQSNIEISALKNAKATPSAYGLSKISGATTVTEDTGLVLSAKEKNPAVNGTLANNILKSKINTYLVRLEAECSGSNDNVFVSDVLYTIPDNVLNGYITATVEKAWPLTTWRNANISVLQIQVEQNKLRVAVCSEERAKYGVEIRVLYFPG